MKCNYKSKIKRRHTITTHDLKEMNDFFEESYHDWLRLSCISVGDFLNLANLKPFEIRMSGSLDSMSISLVFGGMVIGMPIIRNGEQDEYFKENTAFMLFTMAQKLDNVNGGDYFSNIARNFARTELLTKYVVKGGKQ